MRRLNSMNFTKRSVNFAMGTDRLQQRCREMKLADLPPYRGPACPANTLEIAKNTVILGTCTKMPSKNPALAKSSDYVHWVQTGKS